MSSDNNMERPNIDSYADQESTGGKSFRKMRDNPLVPLGMLGFFGTVAYGIHNFKNRPKDMGPGMYVMRFRVFAQSLAVGALVVSVGYTSFKKAMNKQSSPEASGKEV